MEIFNLKHLNKIEGKEKYCVEISNRFATLEDLDTEEGIILLGKLLETLSIFQPNTV
jgi:hypothetical protein